MNAENILDLDLEPTKLAFSLYVIREYFSGPIENIYFEPCDCNFAAKKARWRTAFRSNENQLEFWIIFDEDEALAMVWRLVENDTVMDRGMIHYELRPYNNDAVEEAIASLPVMKPTTH